jgi:hypothetical protein
MPREGLRRLDGKAVSGVTITDDEECSAALDEMGELLRQRPPVDSPKGRRLLWLAKEMKDWVLSTPGVGSDLKQRARRIWRDIDRALEGWGG